MEATASDPDVQQQYGMTVGIPNAGQVNAHRHDQHPRRAVGDLQGRLGHAAVDRPLPAGARRSARSSRKHAGRARAGRRARRPVRPEPGPGGAADVLRPVLVQGSVRHEGHAVDRRRRRALRHRLPGARSHAGRAAARQGRDHLREGEHDRIQRARRRSGRQARTRPRCSCRRSATSAARGPATRPTRTTRRARPRSARARDPACRSAPTSRCAACARRRAPRAAARRITTRSRCSCRRRR